MTIPYIRDQATLLAELSARVRDGSNTRWTAAEKYHALNEVLMTWSNKVWVEHLYTITDGLSASDYDYTLPSYVRPPIYPQLQRRTPHYDYAVESLTNTWVDLPGWELETDGSGGQLLRLHAPPRNVEARVLFYAPNSRVPTTIPTTNAQIDSDDTAVTIGSVIDIDDVGTVKIDGEIIAYVGVTRGVNTTTLNNLKRALYGTTAATHNSSSNVTWCIAVDTPALWAMLLDGWRAYLHAYYLQGGGTRERARHAEALGLYEQKMLNFWQGYSPQRRQSGMTLNRKSFALR